MRVVIVGAGEVGSTIAESLAQSHDVVVIDIDSDRVESLTYSLDVLPIEGDGSDIDTLEEAGVADADMVIASTDDDETNIVACGAANVVSDAFTIARVKSPKYLTAWQRARGAFGVDFMVCSDLLTAEAIVGLAGLPTAQDVDMFADGLVQMTEFEIPAESPVADQTVAEADRFDSLTFAAIIRDDEVVIPRGDTRIEAGDEVVAIGSPESIRAFSSEIAPEERGPEDVVIVGGGEIGYQTARLLEERGFSPRLVEQDEDRARWLAEKLPSTTVLNSDATDQDLLDRENVGMADVIVAALENDQQNLLATLLAKRKGTDRAITVVNTGDFTELFEAVGVDVAVSPRKATAEEITRFTRARRAENVAIIEGDRAEVLELEVDADSVLVDRSIRDVAADIPEGVVIGAITRGDEHITPRGDTIVREGDHVVVFVDTEVLDEVTEKL
ncbi:Trk system potassium transporter TrkA [Halosimplex rubrum]|uniref:Trk system potassium transporter TrkA n=1 Tax=Halosimplex rubrum TaxID=869889 RepID=A0A7D5P3G4_9EURY|nr:Trk system potassium transporter TrkA [Halosimplex rubrum]QLH78181.1 Trk system potassium transporter TrkA [Halosimplex rubrum]